MTKSFWPRLVPNILRQDINPWKLFQGAQFGLFNIELGQTPHPEVEQAIIDEVGSYGRQLGRMGDVLEVLVKHVDRTKLTTDEQDALDVLCGQLAQVRQVKRRALGRA